jgi:hypothetical protein
MFLGPTDFYRDHISPGSSEKRVPLPSYQRGKIHIDSWEILKLKDTSSIVIKAHNGSDWVVSSFDLEVKKQDGMNRVFRAFSKLDGEVVLIGPKRPITASADIGAYSATGGSVYLGTVYGYKP